MHYLCTFRLKFGENMVIFETSTFEFVNLPNFLQNKNLKFGTKIT